MTCLANNLVIAVTLWAGTKSWWKRQYTSSGRRMLTLDLIKHSGQAIPADYMAPQINPDLGNFTLVWILCSPLLLQTLGP